MIDLMGEMNMQLEGVPNAMQQLLGKESKTKQRHPLKLTCRPFNEHRVTILELNKALAGHTKASIYYLPARCLRTCAFVVPRETAPALAVVAR